MTGRQWGIALVWDILKTAAEVVGGTAAFAGLVEWWMGPAGRRRFSTLIARGWVWLSTVNWSNVGLREAQACDRLVVRMFGERALSWRRLSAASSAIVAIYLGVFAIAFVAQLESLRGTFYHPFVSEFDSAQEAIEHSCTGFSGFWMGVCFDWSNYFGFNLFDVLQAFLRSFFSLHFVALSVMFFLSISLLRYFLAVPMWLAGRNKVAGHVSFAAAFLLSVAFFWYVPRISAAVTWALTANLAFGTFEPDYLFDQFFFYRDPENPREIGWNMFATLDTPPKWLVEGPAVVLHHVMSGLRLAFSALFAAAILSRPVVDRFLLPLLVKLDGFPKGSFTGLAASLALLVYFLLVATGAA